jgi:AcrR family transcriptional regulator
MARVREEGLRERIIDSAISIFGRKGYQAATLKDIAESADISTGTVYTYFKDKEDLFAVAFQCRWEEFCDDLEAIAQQPQSLEERFQTLLGTGLEALVATLPAFRGMLFDAGRMNMVKPAILRVVEAIDNLVAPYYSQEALSSEDGNLTRKTLISIFVTGIPFIAAFATEQSVEQDIERLRVAMENFLRAIVSLRDVGQPERS